VSKPTPRSHPGTESVAPISVARTGTAAVLVALGIVWMVVYLNAGITAAEGDGLGWMAALERWNFMIGFVLIFLGLSVAAHPSTPLGRGRGVVVGMLGCFLLGLIWIVVYYVIGAQVAIPLLSNLGQYNLVVGIGFMAVGFVYATKWE
jgi:hypothetical protein